MACACKEQVLGKNCSLIQLNFFYIASQPERSTDITKLSELEEQSLVLQVYIMQRRPQPCQPKQISFEQRRQCVLSLLQEKSGVSQATPPLCYIWDPVLQQMWCLQAAIICMRLLCEVCCLQTSCPLKRHAHTNPEDGSCVVGDKSRAGGVDEPIRELVAFVNTLPNVYTTSSCSGKCLPLPSPERHIM